MKSSALMLFAGKLSVLLYDYLTVKPRFLLLNVWKISHHSTPHTSAIWRLSCPGPVCCTVSGGQARCLEAFPARVGYGAAKGDAVAEDDPAVRRCARVSTGHS